MMQRIKHILSFTLVLCLLLMHLPVSVLAALWVPGSALESASEPMNEPPTRSLTSTGTYGDNLSWTLTGDGILTITGVGPMMDYGDSATPFYDIKNSIKSVIITDGITSIGAWAFKDCSFLMSVTISSSVTTIENGAFKGCTALTNVTIPNSVTSIGSHAFSWCFSLENVVIPSSVTSIGDGAFYYCVDLATVNIPSSVTYVGSAAFRCSGLTNITIPDGVITIDYLAFAECSNLTSVTIPDSVTFVGNSAFYDCSNLTSVTIGNSVSSIEDYTFWACSSLTSVTMPDSVASIGDYAFCCCDGLINIIFGNDIVSIGEYAFSNCDRLTSVAIPDSVTTIGSSAFNGCANLHSVDIGYGVTSIGDKAFYNCDRLSDLVIPENVISIGNSAFNDCDRLRSVTIPDSVVSIGDSAFAYCENLESAVIGSCVSTVGSWVFSWCKKLINVYFKGDAPAIDGNVFYDIIASVYYPKNNPTWTTDIMQDYGGTITWIPYDASKCTHQWDVGEQTKEQTCTEGGEITYTCTLCSETKTEELLPLGHDYVDRMCTRCGKRDFVLEYDTWSFDNSRTFFGSSAEGYYISYSDWDRLTSNLPNIEVTKSLLYSKTVISKEYPEYQRIVANYNVDNALGDEDCVDWGGSCYGMSTWVCLNSYGIRKASDIDGSTSSLSLYNNRAEVESAINYYHNQKYLPNYYSAVVDCMTQSQDDQLTVMESYGKCANQTGETFLIAFNWYSGFNGDGSCDESTATGHAVVGYGWEEIDPKVFTEEVVVDVHDISFNYRILIYDCSYPNLIDEVALYYNDDGIWYVPKHHIVSTASDTAVNKSNNGRLISVTKDVSVLNSIDYLSGEYMSQVPITTMETSANSSYSIECNDFSANISGFTVVSDTDKHGITAMVDCNVTTTGATTATTSTIILPDSDSYKVSSENDSMMFSFKNENYLTTCGVGSSGSMTFFPNGTVSVSAGEDAPYYVNLVANDGYYDRPWQQIEIAGEGATEIAIEMADKGIIIRNDDLDTITIAVTDDGGTTEISGSSDCESVLITDINGTPAVFEDADDNGTYETNITITERKNPFNDVEPGSFYYEPVMWAIENRITNGTSVTTFGPNDQCMRAHVVTFLWRAVGSPEPTRTDNPFVDVKETDFYYKAVMWALENGITSGMDTTHFGPTSYCNRAQVVTFLYRTMGSPELESAENPFRDVAKGSFYEKPVLWAVKNGITNGLTATTFGPNTICNRAQIVTFLYRAFND